MVNISWKTQNRNDLHLYLYKLTVVDTDGNEVVNLNMSSETDVFGDVIDSLTQSTLYEVFVVPLDFEEEVYGIGGSEKMCSCEDFNTTCQSTCSATGNIKKLMLSFIIN